ncbi:mRNA decay activator protein ZFP36L1-like isoform X2 [Ornithodoros turicata]|uniref:mRNA decay activator protein ZFP36L1-like isoform X2 n=1 Tax=Ornithodoros turicata TaxID=34597 RepID=UPI003139F5E1
MNNGSSYAGSRSGFASPLDHRKPPPPVPHSIVGLRRSSSSVTPTSVLRPQSPPKTPLRMTVNGSAVFSATTTSASSNTLQQREHRKLDRSYSEPVDRRPAGQAAAVQQAPQNSSRYKTELCRPFEESGTCKYGDKCQFAHGGHELRTLARHPKYKTELCRTFHTTGFCPYGPRCHFIHNSEESRKSLINNLNPGQPNDITHHQQTRPKALSIGSFGSLGSAGELSPPSSPMYDDAFGNYPLTPASSTCNTAFAFSHDFASLVTSPSVKSGVVQAGFPAFGGSQPTLMSSPFSALSIAGSETAFPFPPARVGGIFEGPPSPVDSLGSELDTISVNGSPGQASCNSPIGRLPIFNQLANPRDGE